MTSEDPKTRAETDVSTADSQSSPKDDNTPSEVADRPKEIGGRGGLDPTRYGDWEKAGRCIDF
jgi:hypothetical protein